MELGKTVHEYQTNFQRAVKPLTDERSAIELPLYSKWLDFITQGLQPLVDFVDFLSDPIYDPLHIHQRPFLETLARRIPTMAQLEQQVGQKTIVSILSDPGVEIFGRFLNKLSSQRPDKQVRTTLSWLKLISFPSAEIDTEKIYTMIKEAESMPLDIKDYFTNYLKIQFTDNLSQVARLLSGYRIRGYNPSATIIPTTHPVKYSHIKGGAAGVQSRTEDSLRKSGITTSSCLPISVNRQTSNLRRVRTLYRKIS